MTANRNVFWILTFDLAQLHQIAEIKAPGNVHDSLP